MKIRFILFSIVLLGVQGCDSVTDKQIASCTKDIQIGLGDPNSFELVSFEEVNLDNGGYRLVLNYTAKNALGGRVRGSDICGFSNKTSIDLDPEDIMNKQRKILRVLN